MNIHADAMIEYAKDWAETDTPWERWEYRFPGTDIWEVLATHPSWATELEYRRKQRTININGYEVPEPLREVPPKADRVYVVRLCAGVFAVENPHFAYLTEPLRDGLVHITKEAAELHAKALLSFTKRQTEQQ